VEQGSRDRQEEYKMTGIDLVITRLLSLLFTLVAIYYLTRLRSNLTSEELAAHKMGAYWAVGLSFMIQVYILGRVADIVFGVAAG
jgi:hypothetical protein